jgi:2-dehydropantoate 2-reductase
VTRYVVLGAGAVGGVVGGFMARAGHEVVLIARGAHLDALRRDGLTLQWPEGDVTLPIETVGAPDELTWRDDDVVLLATKSQHTDAALDDLAAAAPPDVPVLCLQNGVENERRALRRFAHVHGVCVMLPAAHLEPGLVEAYSAPNIGILDLGRYPSGIDDVDREVAAAWSASNFSSEPVADIMAWKHAKLLMNLANVVEAACGPGPSRVAELAHDEAMMVLRVAGIPFATAEQDAARRGDLIRLRPIDGRRRGGGSTWQSLARGVGSVETDDLNGQIVLLGRLHDAPTPVNEMLQRLGAEMARDRTPPGSFTDDELLQRLR